MGEIENINSTFSLIFNDEAQNAVLGHLLLDQKFFIQCLGKIYPNYFNNSKNAIIYSSVIDLFKKTHEFPTINDILNHYDIYNNKQIQYSDFKFQFEKCIEAKLSNNLDTLRNKMTAWMQAMVFRKHGINAINLYNSGRVGEALEIITQIDRERRETSFEDINRVVFGDFEYYLRQSEENQKNALPTGLKLLDNALLEGAERGGLLKGNTTIVMAPTDSGKCLGKDTKILMYDGTIKKVQDIKNGDLLMGPDEKPRSVLSTTKGFGPLYKITPNSGGDPWICNDVHVLSLKVARTEYRYKKDTIINIPVNEYVNKTKNFKNCHRLWRPNGFKFSYKELPIDPYILGLWLGDGNSHNAALTTMDKQIKNIWCDWVQSNGCNVNVYKRPNNKSSTFAAVCKDNQKQNKCNSVFRKIDLLNNKHIPLQYLNASIEQRYKLLAGIIDTDGHYTGRDFEITTKLKCLSEDYAYLARSLGFCVTVTKSIKTIKSVGFSGEYYRVSIRGKISSIPVILNRKKAKDNLRDPTITGFKINSIGQGEYFGFTLDKDNLFVLGDFTVTHNTSTLITMACHNILAEHPVLLMTHEGVPDDIRLQVLCCVMSLIEIKNKSTQFPRGIDRITLYKLKETPEGRKKIKYATDLLDQFLEYNPYNKPGMTIEDVEPLILRAQDARAALNNGKGFDLLVSDYPAKLSTRMASQGHMPWHIVKQVVYDYYVQLAISNKFHSLLAIQTNREGYKTNKGHGSSGQRLLTPDDVADSYNVTQLANNIISVNRDDKAMLNNLMTLLVCKSKNSKTGKAIICRTNFGCRVTHAEELGSSVYDNSDSMRSLVNSLLDKNEIKLDGTPVDESVKRAFKENII